jgi:XTP/dITP diphosphohydrolase
LREKLTFYSGTVKILIASNNQDKVKEIRDIFKLPELQFTTVAELAGAPDVIEDGNTLFENALKKASMLSEFSGLPTIADDTGLEVDALGGKPGLFASRYAGEGATYDDNIEKLIREISQFPASQRTARFRTVAVFFHPQMMIAEEGQLEGTILTNRRGTGGFGYDPIFFLPAKGKTLAELTPAEKNALSHRGQAFRRLYQTVQQKLTVLTPNR